MTTTGQRDGGGWQLGLAGDEGGWDTLSGLLEARGAVVPEPPLGSELLVATFAGTPDLIIMDALGAWLDNLHLAGTRVFTRRAASEPWQDGWRAVFTATPISARLWVRPAWEPAVAGRREVIIDPTHAFGAGFHPTTAACLSLLDEALARVASDVGVEERAQVLDVGTGTGILAIAAARLGADVLGVEIVEAACADAVRNAELNGVADRIAVRHGSMETVAGSFDLVVANVLGPILVKLAPAIVAAVGRELILSGIQPAAEEAVREAYVPMSVADRREDRGWVTLRLRW